MKATMKTLTRLLMVACLVLPFAACKKAEAPVAEVKAPMSAPTTDDRQAWSDYLQDIVPRHMGGIVNQPYVYLLPGESAPDFQDQYDRLLEKTTQDVGRGIVEGNMLAYGGPASAKVADMIVASFKDVPPGTMKGVRVLFIGKAADSDRVHAAVTPAGVEYVFVDTAR
jgi:hypothetical protein